MCSESKTEPFHLNKTLQKPNTAPQHKNLIPVVKHGGCSIVLWGCFDASGPGRLAIIGGLMNFINKFYSRMSEYVSMNCRLIISVSKQQDNDVQHTIYSTKK